jgi:hypothetical protein
MCTKLNFWRHHRYWTKLHVSRVPTFQRGLMILDVEILIEPKQYESGARWEALLYKGGDTVMIH